MRFVSALALLFLSSMPVMADVIVSGDAVVVNGGRGGNNTPQNLNQNLGEPLRYRDSNGRTIEIYNGNSANGQALMMRDGKVTPLSDGEYKLPSGKKVNIKNGRMDAQFGNGNTNNNIKIIPRN